jgi:hypothetical protein
MSTVTIPRLSANSLKEYDLCPRKFALRYIKQTFWPGEAQGPLTAMSLGQHFHLLVQLHALGLDVAPTLAVLQDEEGKLALMWQRFAASPHARPDPGAHVWTEQQLNFFVDDVPVSVRYDRLVEHNDTWTILDWKTGRIKQDRLARDWQTRLYRLALVEAGEALGLGKIVPEQIKLTYWEASSGLAFDLEYSTPHYTLDRKQLQAMATRVRQPFTANQHDDPAYPRTPEHCKQCTYNALCNREVPAPTEAEALKAPKFSAQ